MLIKFQIFHLWVCSEIYNKALPSRHYQLTWPVMNVVFNVAGHERPFQLCISGVAPLRGRRLCRPYTIVIVRQILWRIRN